jgi:hypothetical protein
MGNAFESTFSQVKESELKNVDIATSQQADVETFDGKKSNMSTKQQGDKLTRQHDNKSTIKINQEDLNSAELERKTFYLKPELAEMFKYAKFKKKIGESQIANIALEIYFEQQFGKNWRALLK